MGEGVQINESAKSVRKNEEQYFCDFLNVLIELDERSIHMMNSGVDLALYEDPFHQIIEAFIYKYYGEVKAGVILWWMITYHDNSGKSNLTLKIGEGVNEKEYIVNTPKQLWKALKKTKLK
tara:strand:+ start:3786 stop:4148 length:363 start_codon:yes stop_codon:yes gene_type:complete